MTEKLVPLLHPGGCTLQSGHRLRPAEGSINGYKSAICDFCLGENKT